MSVLSGTLERAGSVGETWGRGDGSDRYWTFGWTLRVWGGVLGGVFWVVFVSVFKIK